MLPAIADSCKKVDPRWQARNPVTLVVEVGSVITTIAFVAGFSQGASGSTQLFVGQVAIWLWFTVLFATFAEAVAEGRGEVQAAKPAPHAGRADRAPHGRRPPRAGAGSAAAQG